MPSHRSRQRLLLAQSPPSDAMASLAWPLWLEHSEQGVLVVDALAQIVYLNPDMRAVMGLGAQSVKHLHDIDAVLGARLDKHETRRRVLLRLFLAAVRYGDEGGWRQVTLVRPALQILHIKPKLLPHGQVMLLARDVTASESVHRQRHEFLTTAAHEFHTPLSSVLGYAELLIRRDLPQAKQRELLTIIHRQGKLLSKLASALLDLWRMENKGVLDFHRQACQLGDLLDQALNAWRAPNDSRLVKLGGVDRTLWFWLDPAKTTQAVHQLLSNAHQFSPQGGDIEVFTQTKSRLGRLWGGITVRDHGMGMSTQVQQHVFERFYRANPGGGVSGTGLGLSLVKEITERQAGHVHLYSRLGVGTDVTLWFPTRTPHRNPDKEQHKDFKI